MTHSPDPANLPPDTQVDPNAPQIDGVKLVGPLGRGMTAKVYLGRVGAREVAVKVPTPETLGNHAAAERFANEVRLSLQLKHPNLVAGISGVAFGPQAHLVMPRYKLGTLTDQQEKGVQFNQQQKLQILADIAAGLGYLHAQGGVHQDVKPQNVYISGDYTPGKAAALGDFGSSYLAGGKKSVSGSPFYMSPEIYEGEASSSASDVYSFGVMCYELLGGKRPYQGSSYEELMVAHMTQFAQPLSALVSDLPRPLVKLIGQSMAKKPAERPAIEQLEQAIKVALGQAEEPTPPTPAREMGRGSTVPPKVPAQEPAKEKGGLLSRLFKR